MFDRSSDGSCREPSHCRARVISTYFVRVSSRLIAAGMIPLAATIGIDVYIVGRLAVPEWTRFTCVAIALVVFACAHRALVCLPLLATLSGYAPPPNYTKVIVAMLGGRAENGERR